MFLSHKIEIKPNSATKKLFESYFGYSRFCFNKSLEIWNRMYDSGEKPNKRLVRNELVSYKKTEDFAWMKEYNSYVLKTAVEDLDAGFQKFFKKISFKPKFKSRKQSKDSFRINMETPGIIHIKEKKLFLPRFPYGIKLTELPRFNGEIRRVTISKKADKYFAGFVINVEEEFPQIESDFSVGIDLGVKTFAVLGYGDTDDRTFAVCEYPKKLKGLYDKVDDYNRILSRKVKDSKNYTAMRIKLQKLYLTIKNIQNDFLHKVSHEVVSNFSLITIEDLNVQGLLKNRKISRRIAQSLFYRFKEILKYKSELYGNKLVLADRFFPSTQMCSHCGYVRTKSEKVKLSERTYICPSCGIVEDRDENAAYNLKLYGEQLG